MAFTGWLIDKSALVRLFSAPHQSARRQQAALSHG